MVLALFGFLAAWLLLPFLPALHEAYRQRDSAPLALSDLYREDRRHGLSASAGRSAHETDPIGAAPDALGAVAGSFTGEPGLRLAELRVRGVARLGEGTTIDQRLVVGDSAEIGAGSTLHGSAEAGDVLWLGPGCHFERLHAPSVCTGAPGTDALLDVPDLTDTVRQPGADFVLPDGGDIRGGRALIVGDLSLPDGARYTGDLVVRGDLTLGVGARVRGSVKTHGSVRLADGAVVTGNAVSDEDISVGENASIGGAALAEDALTLARGARIGRPSAPSSATGREVSLADDVTVYGTVWARERGWIQRAA